MNTITLSKLGGVVIALVWKVSHHSLGFFVGGNFHEFVQS